jgi:hypothetical protein
MLTHLVLRIFIVEHKKTQPMAGFFYNHKTVKTKLFF